MAEEVLVDDAVGVALADVDGAVGAAAVDDDDLLEVLEAAGGDYLSLSDTLRFDEAGLRRWISNAPEQKPMSPEDQRGMPAFPGLTEEDLEALIAYLHTLD